MPEIQFSGAIRTAVGDTASMHIEADTIRELLRKLVERHPRLQGLIDEGIAVSINGHIYRDGWSTEIPKDAEVFLMPRVPGG